VKGIGNRGCEKCTSFFLQESQIAINTFRYTLESTEFVRAASTLPGALLAGIADATTDLSGIAEWKNTLTTTILRLRIANATPAVIMRIA
jgi:hypothetical protein